MKIIRNLLLALLLSVGITAPAPADSKPKTAKRASSVAVTYEEVEALREELAAQQKEISELREELRRMVGQRIAGPEGKGSSPGALRQLAGAIPIIPVESAAQPIPQGGPAGGPAADSEKPSPLTFKIGSASLTPFGFMDFTGYFRSTGLGSGIGTSFGGIPLSNTPAGRLSETRFSAQNSRIGLRIDTKVGEQKILGYLESDFLGLAPTSLAITSNSDSLRMRLYWVDITRGKFELLGGQSWSMLTPNRKGLSPLPGDIFYSQDMDTNYQVGLTWTRAPQVRFIYHPNDQVAWGMALESPEQFVGGAVTFPSALAGALGGELNTGGATTGTPNLHPDIISKIAFDPKVGDKAIHFEIAGVLRSFKLYNPVTNTSSTATGGGVALNFNLELFKNPANSFRFIGDTYFSDGGGRYIFGLGPDLIVRGDGSPSLVHSGSAIGGFEYSHKQKDDPAKETLYYGYYGGAYFRRNSAIDPANGKLVGYGFSGSSASANRAIQEATFGVIQTFWKNARYGALKLITQYSYLIRDPWFVPLGSPKNAKSNMVYVNLRYELPGAPPAVK